MKVMNKLKAYEPIIAISLLIITFFMCVIMAIDLIPAFGQWLDPREQGPSPTVTSVPLTPELPIETRTTEELPGMLDNPLADSDGIIWQATFYGNKELIPPIILQGEIRGTKRGLQVDWGVNSPSKEIPEDSFSAIFSTTHDFLGRTYCFVLEIVDDGAKLFIDGREERSVWWGYTPEAVYKDPISLAEGPHDIQLQYYEEEHTAAFHLFWYGGSVGVGPECVTVGHPGIK